MEILEFIGGPFHGQARAVESGTLSWLIPLEVAWRRNSTRPEWMGYRREGDTAVFKGILSGTFTEVFDAFFIICSGPAVQA